jgi:hypothetical protein
LRDGAHGQVRGAARRDDGTLADITAKRSVVVKAQLAANRSGLQATRIKFD